VLDRSISPSAALCNLFNLLLRRFLVASKLKLDDRDMTASLRLRVQRLLVSTRLLFVADNWG
jgi:hypothetical protein